MFQKITGIYSYPFLVDSDGMYCIFVSATCKKKNFLRVEIDGLALKGILQKSRNEYFNIPPAWNGNELKGTSETIVFIIKLSKGNHNLKFISMGEAEIIVEPEVSLLNKSGLVMLFKDIQSEEKDCQPWITLALINLPLSILDVSVNCKKKFLDSDDVKLVIDGKIQKNQQVAWHGKNWFWRGYQLKGKTQTERFYPDLPTGIHYVELWADRRPILKDVSIVIENIQEKNSEYKDRTEDWWVNWQQIKKYKYKGVSGKEDYNQYDDLIIKAVAHWNYEFFSDAYPPIEPLDPNLVKVMLFQESRVGNDPNGKLNIMQVGNYGDSSLDVLNGKGEKKEYELRDNKIWEVNYHGEARVVEVYDSVYWGVRWLYHKAQWTDDSKMRHWHSWQEAVSKYGPPREEYVNNIWNIYKQGIKKEKSATIYLWSIILFILLSLLSSKSQAYSLDTRINDKIIQEQNQEITGVELVYSKDKKYFLAQVEREKDWWEDLRVGKIDGNIISWLSVEKSPGEQAILSAQFIDLEGFVNPLIEVYGLTHAGHGHLYIYEIRGDISRLLLETPAVDYNSDISWSPDNHDIYGYGMCGEVFSNGKLSSSYGDYNNDGILDMMLFGTEKIVCEQRYLNEQGGDIIEVDSQMIRKVFLWDKREEKYFLVS